MPYLHRLTRSIALAVAFTSSVGILIAKQVPISPATQTSTPTFEMKISSPTLILHVGEPPIIKLITSNPTDHVVYAGSDARTGIRIELLNEKGEDVGMHAMGKMDKDAEREFVLHSNYVKIRPGLHETLTWSLNPEPGHLVPGTYKLRVHRRDTQLGIDFYSNVVMLTIVP